MLVAAVCLSALSLCATENADAKETFFIVYQSGGKITPFLDTEIDSIGFSKFDTDSVEHPQWHSQVVYTPDSAYVFPLAQVDSVGFQALPTIYKPQVIHMTSAWEPLVEGYEDNTITFASGISSVWRPKKGDVLFYNEFTERFPYGYSGKVEDMTFDNDRYVITMGEIDLDDIYEQVMNVSRTEWIDTYELPDSPETPPPKNTPGKEQLHVVIGGHRDDRYQKRHRKHIGIIQPYSDYRSGQETTRRLVFLGKNKPCDTNGRFLKGKGKMGLF